MIEGLTTYIWRSFMIIQVIGHSFDVGESLTEYVKSSIQKKVEKYNLDIISMNVVFSSAPHKKVSASIRAQIKGSEIFAKAEDDDAYLAFNAGIADVETQIIKISEKEKFHK